MSDSAYLYMQTQDNQDSVLLSASIIHKKNLVRKILVLNTNAKSGFPGYNVWEKKLNELGVSNDYIEGVKIKNTTLLNTLTDSEAMVRFAKLRQYQSVYIVAAPFHQLRAFMTAVSVALHEFPELKLYSYVGNPLPWSENVVHSQGETRGTRSSLIKKELDRIDKYYRKGDLASVEEILTYLNNRDLSG